MYDKNEIIESLKKGSCKIVFTKVNGDERVMNCTLHESFLPEQIDVEEHIQKKKPNQDVLAVWDSDIGGWRSFRWDSIKEFNVDFWIS
jgi:hypothetical protein